MSNSLRINSTAAGYTVEGIFDGLEPVTAIFTQDMPAATLDNLIRIGLVNVLRDSMAGKAGDPVEARQALADKIARLQAGDVTGSGRGGPRKTEEERVRDAYLDEIIAKNKLKVEGLTKAQLRDRVYVAKREAVDREVRARMKRQDAVTVDLGELGL